MTALAPFLAAGRQRLAVRWMALALALACFAGPAAAQMKNGVELVKADLLADTTAIAPGKPFTVGLRLRMAPHWHTYWQYSGDAGLPTKIDWQLPAGFKAGPIQWPVPQKIDSPGDIVNYGYDDEVVLLTEITPPAQLPSGDVALKAKATWLVCAESCVPGEKEFSLNLPTGGDAQAANAEVFAKYRALLPRQPDFGVWFTLPPLIPGDPGLAGQERKVSIDKRVIENDSGKYVTVGLRGDEGTFERTPEFYPLPGEDTEAGHPQVQIELKGAGVGGIVPIVSAPADGPQVGGLVVFRDPLSIKRLGGQGEVLAFFLPVDFPFTSSPVRQGTATPTPGPAASTPATIQRPPQPTPAAAPPAGPAGSLWYFLLLGFVGGMILNVMPCVLPVISLKLLSFVKQANTSPARVMRLGLAYAAGVFTWFLGFAALIVGLKRVGHAVGYAFLLQSPWFLVGLSAVTFVFALNLLGVFEIILPGGIINAADGAAHRQEGYAGAFVQGVLATVLGSACMAPLFGEALAFAFSQGDATIIAMFAAIAAGLSAPFVLLSARPQWLKFLPRPGVWMERVKQGTGFLLLATVLWLLFVLGHSKGPNGIIWTGALLLVLGIACWVQGAFNTLSADDRARWLARIIIAVVVLGGGWFCVGQIAQAKPPEIVAAAGEPQTFTAKLDAALKSGRTVFVDFTADWCVSCKVNERVVLASEPVKKALRDDDVISLTADYTVESDDIAQLLKRFNAVSVPLYVVYPAGEPDKPVVLPTVLTQEIVLNALADAKPDSPARKRVSLSGFFPH